LEALAALISTVLLANEARRERWKRHDGSRLFRALRWLRLV
jgi:hypothetical protein